jgi:tetratricopeptide (TPR) repeat protein
LYARVSAWAGDTDEAVNGYERYLHAKPDAADVWLELARAESWRGNYAAARRALDTYRDKFGASADYSRALAAVLASGGRPGQAEDLLAPLIATSPDDYNLNLTRTIALAEGHRNREAAASLDTVRSLSPDARETHDAERLVRTLLASSAESGVAAYSDSDHLQVQRFAPQATLSLLSGTRLSGGFERGRLEALRGSGLEALDGSTTIEFGQAWAGVAQTFAGRFTLSGRGGQATVNHHDVTTYAVGFEARPADALRIGFTRTEGLFIVSPRTVGLGLTNTNNRMQVEWNPSLQYTVAFDGSYQELSDGNRRWETTIAPRRAVARTARLNLDLGFSAYQLETTEDLDHGYYDPRRYEFYGATAYPYFKIRENVGLGLSIALGAQRDTSSPTFHFGGNVSGEATFGIYAPWAVKVNSSTSVNGRLETGAYSGVGAGVALVRRF